MKLHLMVRCTRVEAVMKLSGFLAVAAMCAACSDRPASEQPSTSTVEPEQRATATTGERPAEPQRAAPEPKPKPRAEVDLARRDEQAAKTGPVTTAAQQSGVNADGAILQDFNARVKAYLDIHKDAEKGSAKLKETENPAEITQAQETLAARIRSARAGAKQGDIFTAEIRNRFRLLLAPELKGEDGRDAKAVMKEDAPSPASIPFKVNAKYPEGAPLPSVPASLLLNLPTLPEPLEYRIIGKHLVLLDTGANIIVDFIPNAIK
jgi:hypothetical protein